MKLKIKFTSSCPHGDYHIGEEGYMINAVRGGDSRPYVVCVVNKRVVLAAVHAVEVIENLEKGE